LHKGKALSETSNGNNIPITSNNEDLRLNLRFVIIVKRISPEKMSQGKYRTDAEYVTDIEKYIKFRTLSLHKGRLLREKPEFHSWLVGLKVSRCRFRLELGWLARLAHKQ
jgi:hypothetical protein